MIHVNKAGMKTTTFLSLITLCLALSACDNSAKTAEVVEQSATPLEQLRLEPLQNCSALQHKLIDNWVENLLSYQRYMPGQFIDTPVVLSQEDSLSGATNSDASTSPDNVSQTNTQEAGVDEADRVKTDSKGNLYIAQHDKLVITDAWPAHSMNILSSLELGGPVTGLYLSEADNLVVALVRTPFIYPPVLAPTDSITPYIWWNPKTDLVFIDINDPSQPVINKRLRLDGHLISSRVTDGRLHVVQGFYLDRFLHAENEQVQDLLNAFHDAYTQENNEAMTSIKSQLKTYITENLDIEDVSALLPHYQFINNQQQEAAAALSCDQLYAPIIDTRDNHLLVVTSLDIDGDNIRRAAALGSGWVVYASQQDLFIVQPGYSWWWRPHQQQQSAIHHFSIADQQPAYLSTGLVKGFVNDSFSLSYHDNHLRVATTQNFWNLSDRSDIRSTNHLYVLADNGSAMDIIGSVNNYAHNERIFSARFIKERGYVVTFRQIDPLFSFDLSDPANPFIAGELKIPGFSSYMHPIDDTHLLTIGREGDDNGASNQIAIKLFDVSDLANPSIIDSYSPDLGDGYSWSQANWDHHAFTYYAAEGLLAVPLSSYHSVSEDYFMGMLLLNVDTSAGLSLAGTVDHEDLLQQISCSANFLYCDSYYYRWLSQPTRSIFMTQDSDTTYYSLSNIGLKAVSTDNLQTTTGSLLLPSPEHFYELYY